MNLTFPRLRRCFYCNAPFTAHALREIYCCHECMHAWQAENIDVHGQVGIAVMNGKWGYLAGE